MDITTFSKYQQSVAAEIEKDLKKLNIPLEQLTVEQVKENNPVILAIPGVENKDLEIEPLVFDRNNVDTQKAIDAILSGDIFWEHTAAGEATRLALGTKYQLDKEVLRQAFQTHPNFIEEFDDREAAKRKTMTVKEREQSLQLLDEVSALNMGIRHLVQQIIDIKELAIKHDCDQKKAIANQSNLIILNEKTAETIIEDLRGLKFLGLDPAKTFFMIQRSAHGFNLFNGKIELDETSDRRLYNHGGMRLQTAMENEIFYFPDLESDQVSLSSTEYEQLLSTKNIMLSINIEDLDWLENSIDIYTTAMGLELAEQDFEMIMTAVKQKDPPQKGGFFCKLEGQNVCIETDSDPEMFNADPQILSKIKYLNKNMNYYPNPAMMIKKMKETDLPVHPTVKGTAIYPQTPQGDLNFILKTQIIQEKQPKAIRNLKTQKDILETLLQFKKQDQKGEVLNYLETIKS